ncbi:MAG TPA: hypothetical protein GXX75_05360 [Clostridiales bacterium]|nr:hypothetical protein [Clostridiales bacterium]
MAKRFYFIAPLLLLLLFIVSCKQDTGTTVAEISPTDSSGTQSISDTREFLPEADWPADLAPDELPEYTAGTVTASAVDGEEVLTIKVTDTGKDDLDDYLEILKNAGWSITSGDLEAEAELGLHTVTFALQGGGTVLQIDVYTQEAGSWPFDEVPTDILEPRSGMLVGTVEVLETGEGNKVMIMGIRDPLAWRPRYTEWTDC